MSIEATTVQATFELMQKKLGTLLAEQELREKSELVFEINRIKKEKNAIILGHNYMEPALYNTVPDVLGDSLELSRKAAEATADIIIFCGVEFMAETAKLLNPTRKVLLPAREAGCSLASSITAEDVRKLKAAHPGVPAICYINTYADVKAECDACCTSGNADRIAASFDSDTLIFIPDEFLAQNVARETGKTVIVANKDSDPSVLAKSPFDIIGWNGRCEVHEQFTVFDIEDARRQYPDVVVLAHPECPPDVTAAADFSGSTSRMIHYVKTHDAPRYLILTECAMADNIIAENPEKEVLRLCSVRCPHMNQITLEGVLNALRTEQKEIFVDEAVAVRARASLDRMLMVM
jgi:quinolinate synthase